MVLPAEYDQSGEAAGRAAVASSARQLRCLSRMTSRHFSRKVSTGTAASLLDIHVADAATLLYNQASGSCSAVGPSHVLRSSAV